LEIPQIKTQESIPMANPVLVEVTRGALVESRHRGTVIVVDGDGGTVFSTGETDVGVFPRSACKVMQALPLVESGAADAYGFGNKELALACASHSGEPEHASLAGEMLKTAGKSESDLECGAHWSFEQAALIEQVRTLPKPNQLHNNCSGKHAGFVCACAHQGIEVKGYVTYDHPLQREIRATMEGLTGAILSPRQLRHRWLLDPDLCRATQRSCARICEARNRPRVGATPR